MGINNGNGNGAARQAHGHGLDPRKVELLQNQWDNDPRWQGIKRDHTAEDALRARGTIDIKYTFAELGANRLWHLLHSEPYINALGALTGNQAVQQVAAGLKAIYLSGWQVAADANLSSEMYPDQSLYPSNSVPAVVKRINNALQRADQIQLLDGKGDTHWFAPIVADAEAGFGGPLNAFELMKQMIEAGAAGVHFEDQLSSAKKCGHLGGKVLVPTQEFIVKLSAARLAADACGVPTVLVARTDADAAQLLTSDIDERDHAFIKTDLGRTVEGFYHISGGTDAAIARGLSYAPYADMIWCETSHPDIAEAKRFAEAIKAEYPEKLLAYNCSPSFNWKRNLDDTTIKKFQRELGAMGYKFQFVTLAGFHALNLSMFELARGYKESGMFAYSEFQKREFEAAENHGFAAVTHQKFVGTGYFDQIMTSITCGESSVTAMEGSTETEQFTQEAVPAK